MLEALKEKYSKLYPQFIWKIRKWEKTNYSPCSQELTFESDNFFSQRFVAINEYEKHSPISLKHGQYQLNIYLYPIIKCYGEDTTDRNPTLIKYFPTIPSEKDFDELIENKKSTYFSKP